MKTAATAPFDWLEPRRVQRPPTREAMYRREIEDRAALLHRLNFSRPLARQRLLENIDWDFEIGAGPRILGPAEVDAILDQTWKRGGPTSGGAPIL